MRIHMDIQDSDKETTEDLKFVPRAHNLPLGSSTYNCIQQNVIISKRKDMRLLALAVSAELGRSRERAHDGF